MQFSNPASLKMMKVYDQAHGNKLTASLNLLTKCPTITVGGWGIFSFLSLTQKLQLLAILGAKMWVQ